MPSERRDYDNDSTKLHYPIVSGRTNALRKKGLRRSTAASIYAARSSRTNALRKKGLRPAGISTWPFSKAEPMPSERRDYDVLPPRRYTRHGRAEPMPSERRDYDRPESAPGRFQRPNQCPQKEGITTPATTRFRTRRLAEPMPSERRDYDASSSAIIADKSEAEPMPSERRDYDKETKSKPFHFILPNQCPQKEGITTKEGQLASLPFQPNQCPQKEGITTGDRANRAERQRRTNALRKKGLRHTWRCTQPRAGRPNQCPQKEGITTCRVRVSAHDSCAEPMPSERRDYDARLHRCSPKATAEPMPSERRDYDSSASTPLTFTVGRTNALRKKGLRHESFHCLSPSSLAEPMPSERRDYDYPDPCRW